MFSIYDYLLEKDKIIGHELIGEPVGLCRRGFKLKDVYYNQFISQLSQERKYSSLPELLLELSCRDSLSLVLSFNPRKGEATGMTKTSRRANTIGYLFRNQYLQRAREILLSKEQKVPCS